MDVQRGRKILLDDKSESDFGWGLIRLNKVKIIIYCGITQ